MLRLVRDISPALLARPTDFVLSRLYLWPAPVKVDSLSAPRGRPGSRGWAGAAVRVLRGCGAGGGRWKSIRRFGDCDLIVFPPKT